MNIEQYRALKAQEEAEAKQKLKHKLLIHKHKLPMRILIKKNQNKLLKINN